MIDIRALNCSYHKKKSLIIHRLHEFREVINTGDDKRIFQELVFCILTANATAKMGIRSVELISNVLLDGTEETISKRLRGVHRFPNFRSKYIIHTREYLKNNYNFKLKELILSLDEHYGRRDFFATNKDIKGIGYKESSHFLRNIGYSGYVILDKHILQTMYELNIINSPKPPGNRDKYFEIENKLMQFSNNHNFNIDELDLLIWSEKTGEILK